MNIHTLSIARDLRAAELPSDQAEAIAAAIGRAVQETSATKGDLELVRTGLDAKIEQVRGDLEKKIEQVRTDIERARNQLVLWMIGSQVTFAGLIIAFLRH